MSEKPKSILDGIEVKLTDSYKNALGIRPDVVTSEGEVYEVKTLSIVGHCPQCGSPIYGHSYVHTNKVATVKRTCDCVGFTLRDATQMQTK